MNPHILFVIDHKLNPDKYTKEQLSKNAAAADYAAYASDAASADADYAVYAAWADDASHWVDEYFKDTGEKKQDYINAINSRG